MIHPQKVLAPFVFYFSLSLLLSPAAWSQDFSSIDSDLVQLENLIVNTLSNTEEQQRLLEDLRKNLDESGNLIDSYGKTITGQENLLRGLQTRLNEMSEIYRMQSALSAKYERSSKFWKTFTLIGIPLAALISGGVVWAVK
jgi:DNA repair ATPase RecN